MYKSVKNAIYLDILHVEMYNNIDYDIVRNKIAYIVDDLLSITIVAT